MNTPIYSHCSYPYMWKVIWLSELQNLRPNNNQFSEHLKEGWELSIKRAQIYLFAYMRHSNWKFNIQLTLRILPYITSRLGWCYFHFHQQFCPYLSFVIFVLTFWLVVIRNPSCCDWLHRFAHLVQKLHFVFQFVDQSRNSF